MKGAFRSDSREHIYCQLCERELPLSFHHLIPRSTHKRRWVRQNHTVTDLQRGVWVCSPCHSAIHRFIEHNDLAQTYNTIEALLSHDDLGKFIRWSRKQSKRKKVRRKK